MKRYILATAVVLPLLLLTGCKEDNLRKPYGNGSAPGDVTVTQVRNTAGGAVIKYKLPQNDDLLYVKAKFEQKPGILREARASAYLDSVVIEGLANADPRQVVLYAVNRIEKHSPGIPVDIKPEAPPIAVVAASLEAEVDFGGFAMNYSNPDGSPIYFNIYYKNPEKTEDELHDVVYSERHEGRLKVRGLKDLPTHFSIYVTDKWDNRSEPYVFDLTPRREYELDGKQFKEVFIANVDKRWNAHGGKWEMMFDNNLGLYNFGHVQLPTDLPHSTTIDLGETVLLSRMRFWQYLLKEFEFYAHASPRHFQIWGCDETVDFRNVDNYQLLLDKWVEKPSGGDYKDPVTEEDVQAMMDGHEFEFDSPAPVRYLRFISLETWSGMLASRIAEMKFWGAAVEQGEPEPEPEPEAK